MLASVLVAVPAVAADPEPDYTATFDACGDVDESGFTDVPSAHANAGDIDCIAYYGVTQGTSATTYSPLMSVTREHMALFLTRLAGLVDIPMADDPGDPGFTDTGDLGDESQAAVAQLADLGITQGTSSTTYSPADPVTRGQMALFISRLMNLMDPMADGEIGLSSTTQYGHTPSDVADNDDDADIGTPFTDLGRATNDEYDAITQLYELGVASGISDTAYSPGSPITRATMAGFMAAALDHSNARPAGLSIQSSTAEGWGDQEPTLAVSVRDDSFAPIEDQAVDMFSSASANMGLRKDGTCNFRSTPDDVFSGDAVTGNCVWNDNDEATDVGGNIIADGEVLAGNTRVFYAWIGEDDGDKFDADDTDESTVSVQAKYEQDELQGGSDINTHAHDVGDGDQVDLRNGRDVTATAQLKDENGNDVERSGVSIRVEYRQGEYATGDARNQRAYVNTNEAILVTGDDGSVSFAVVAPANSTRVNDQERKDSVVFVELDSKGNDTKRTDEVKIHWIEETPVLTSDSIDKSVYVLADKPSIGTTVRLWDQYGNSHRSNSNQKVSVTYTDSEEGDDADSDSAVRQVISRGYARWATTIEVESGETVSVTYDVRQLARNSDGSPVRDDDAGDPTGAEIVADFTTWMGLGTGQSSATRQALIDDLDVTYNDGRVITSDAEDNDGNFTSNVPLYQAHADQNDQSGDDENDDADPLDQDPILVFARAGTDQALRNILNTHALDTYVDRGDGMTAPSMADHDADDADASTVVIHVVEKADSHDVADDGGQFVTHVLQSENTFLTAADDTVEPDLVYSYDDDDIFINSTGDEGVEVTMAKFEGLIDDNSPTKAANDIRGQIEVIAYDVDGTSIFRVITTN